MSKSRFPDRRGTRCTPNWQDEADRQFIRQRAEAQEHAETLIEDRGLANARAWAIHCANRDTSGFWSRVVTAIENIDSAQEERSTYDV